MRKIVLFFGLFYLSFCGACKTTKSANDKTTTEASNAFEPKLKTRGYWSPSSSLAEGNCAHPLTELSFGQGLTMLTKENNKEKQLSQAKEIVSKNCLTSYQLVRICELFGKDEDKLMLSKYAYTRVFDPSNYQIILDHLKLSSSKNDLQEFIKIRTFD